MKSLNPRGFVLAFIPSLILVCAPQAAAQANTTPEPVKVVNTTKNPVPTVAQGTTKISGNVDVTNSSLPVTGSVSITNNSVPVNVTNSPLAVSGTVNVGNLPLDANGNVRTSVAPDTAQYQFQSVIGGPCDAVNNVPTDFCTGSGATVESVLDTYSSQGYEVLAVSPLSVGINGIAGLMVYTLKAPVKGAHKKASPVQR
jgi:hypothetical protein